MKRFLLLFLVFAALGGCTKKPTTQASSLPSQNPKTQTIRGFLAVPAEFNTPTYWAVERKEFGECSGNDSTQNGGYSDVTTGAQVTVKDESSKLIATGILGVGAAKVLGTYGGCIFPVLISNVPPANFYTIELGNRKGITYSAQQMEDAKWEIQLNLGD